MTGIGAEPDGSGDEEQSYGETKRAAVLGKPGVNGSLQAHWGATVLKTLSETCKATGSKWAVSYCTGTLSWGKSEDSVTLGLPSWSDRGGKRRETAGTGSICSQALGSSKQGQSSNSLQMEPTGAWPPAGDQSPTMARTHGGLPSSRAAAAAALARARSQLPRDSGRGASLLCRCRPRAEKGAFPQVPTFAFCTSADPVTSSGYIQCRSWQKCQTRAEGCREGSGLVDRSSGESNRGSGWLALIQCAVGSQWPSVKDSDIYTVT